MTVSFGRSSGEFVWTSLKSVDTKCVNTSSPKEWETVSFYPVLFDFELETYIYINIYIYIYIFFFFFFKLLEIIYIIGYVIFNNK